MKDKLKLIIFDWGNVLVPSWNLDENWIFNEALSLKELYSFLDLNFLKEKNNELHNKWGQSKDKLKDMSIYIIDYFNLCNVNYKSEDVKKFEMIYERNTLKYKKFEDICNYAASLNTKCFLGLLSNVPKLEQKIQLQQIKSNLYDYIWQSCDMECIKPYPEIYDKVMIDLKNKNLEILFLDDNEKNLEYPKKIGWKVYCVKNEGSLEEIKKVCENFLEN